MSLLCVRLSKSHFFFRNDTCAWKVINFTWPLMSIKATVDLDMLLGNCYDVKIKIWSGGVTVEVKMLSVGFVLAASILCCISCSPGHSDVWDSAVASSSKEVWVRLTCWSLGKKSFGNIEGTLLLTTRIKSIWKHTERTKWRLDDCTTLLMVNLQATTL